MTIAAPDKTIEKPPVVTPEAEAAVKAKAEADAKAAADKVAADAAAAAGNGAPEDKGDFVPAGVDKTVALKFAEKVRKQEKDKLYPKLEKLEKDLKDRDAALTKAQEDLKVLKAQADEAGTKGLSETQVLQKRIDELQKQVTATNESIVKEKSDAEQRVKNAELQAYRERKLRDAGGVLIPELVLGRTEEEIDASVEASKAKYTELYSKALAEAQAKLSGVHTAGVTQPQGAGAGNPNLADATVVKEIPLKDWKAKRAETLAAIAKAEGRA